MQLFSTVATIFKKKFCPQKVEKNTLKSCSEKLKSTFWWAAQMAQTEEFMFQNVAYRPTVYRTGALDVHAAAAWSLTCLTLMHLDTMMRKLQATYLKTAKTLRQITLVDTCVSYLAILWPSDTV